MAAWLHRARARASRGVVATVVSALCATVLLAIIFLTEFVGLKYSYGAGLIFVAATAFLGFALFRFAQEAQIGLNEADEHQ